MNSRLIYIHYRRTIRSRGTGPFVRRAPTMELLRLVGTVEHARWSLVPSERDGHILDRV